MIAKLCELYCWFDWLSRDDVITYFALPGMALWLAFMLGFLFGCKAFDEKKK